MYSREGHPNMRIRLLVAVTLTALATLTSVASAQAPAKPASAPAPRQGPSLESYTIGPEDVLAISVWKNDAMIRIVPVRPDGMISLPLLDDIQAAGLTPMQLRDVLAKRIVEYIPNPEVSVIVNEVRSFKVSVMGEEART